MSSARLSAISRCRTRPACHAARARRVSADDAARLTQREAVADLPRRGRANRLTFWTTIASLRARAERPPAAGRGRASAIKRAARRGARSRAIAAPAAVARVRSGRIRTEGSCWYGGGPVTRIVTLPGDGIGPEVMAAGLQVLGRADELRRRGARLRRRLDRRARRRAHRRGARRLRARRRRAAGGRRRPEVGHDRPRQAAPRAGPARRCARGSACSPTCARCARSRRSTRRARCARSASPAPTCWSCASSPAASTSARRSARATARATSASTRVEEIERIARVAFGAARTPRHERRQGQRARDLAAVARGRRRASTPRSSRTSSSSTCSSTTPRCSSSADPTPLRRDRDREHVRRHPQRRGGDDHRLDRDAAERLARRRRARAVRARARLGARHRRHRASPTRSRCSSRWRCMLRHGLRLGSAGGGGRIRGRSRARRRAADARSRRRGDAPRRPRRPCSHIYRKGSWRQ